jgi:hypothetical protein
VTIVEVDSETYGRCPAVATKVTAEEIEVLMMYLPPAGTSMVVRFFPAPDSESAAYFKAIVEVIGPGKRPRDLNLCARVVRMKVEKFS